MTDRWRCRGPTAGHGFSENIHGCIHLCVAQKGISQNGTQKNGQVDEHLRSPGSYIWSHPHWCMHLDVQLGHLEVLRNGFDFWASVRGETNTWNNCRMSIQPVCTCSNTYLRAKENESGKTQQITNMVLDWKTSVWLVSLCFLFKTPQKGFPQKKTPSFAHVGLYPFG